MEKRQVLYLEVRNTYEVSVLPLSGGSLPHRVFGASAVPFGETFLLVGGRTDLTTKLDTIYQYEPDGDNWRLLPAKLREAREGSTAFQVRPSPLITYQLIHRNSTTGEKEQL